MKPDESRRLPSPFARLGAAVAAAAGDMFGAAFGLLARLRGTRALHPVGRCGAGRWEVDAHLRTGVPMVDGGGALSSHLRWSRAMGRRRGLDIDGLAVRVLGPRGGDLLFATTGTGRLTRHLLRPVLLGRATTLTTLLPLVTPDGRHKLFRADPVGAGPGTPPRLFRMATAEVGGPWSDIGVLHAEWSASDCGRRHHPASHPPEGLRPPGWVRRVREPAYHASQRVPADGR